MSGRFITLSAPDISDEERRQVAEVLAGTTLSFGPKLLELEKRFAERFEVRHAIAVSSGTAGLHLLMIAAGVSDGDLVVTSPFSFIASANAAMFERGIPVFVDIDPETLMPDEHAMLEVVQTLHGRGPGWKHLLPREGCAEPGSVRAVLPVHVFGRPMDHAELITGIRRMEIPVIDDACEAVGATIDGDPVGSSSDATVLAFYPNKQMTTGEGGMILTNRDDWAMLARSLRNQGRSDGGLGFQHDRLGYNYRLDEMSAALGIAQLNRLDELLDRRAAVASGYGERLQGTAGLIPLPPLRDGLEQTWFVYVVRLEEDVDRTAVMRHLAAEGVPSRPYFEPIHLQPFYVERFGYREGDFPHAEEAGRRLLALPFHGGLPDEDLDYVVSVLRRAIPRCRVPATRINLNRPA